MSVAKERRTSSICPFVIFQRKDWSPGPVNTRELVPRVRQSTYDTNVRIMTYLEKRLSLRRNELSVTTHLPKVIMVARKHHVILAMSSYQKSGMSPVLERCCVTVRTVEDDRPLEVQDSIA